MSAELCVLLPVKNAAGTLAMAIESIRAQTERGWRLNVIDDGSADGSREIAERLAAADSRIEVTGDARSVGLADRLNAAVDAAAEPYVARMDADDVSYPDRFERQLEVLRGDVSIDVVGCEMLVFDTAGAPRGKRAAPRTHAEIVAQPLAGFPLYHPTWLGRREWFARHRYDATAQRCEDQVLLFDAYRDSSFANLDRVLLGYFDPGVRLRRELKGRLHYARAIARRTDRRSDSMRAAGGQVARGIIESAVVPLGLEERILRHRTRPLSAQELDRWATVSESLGVGS